jgi:aldose 1-epimerase
MFMEKSSFKINSKQISVFNLKNKNGVAIGISNFGCRLISIIVPDKFGNSKDILLGYDDLKDYITDDNYLGAVVGRFANVIQNGKFQLNGKEYQLVKNFGEHTIHGGEIGFDKVIWEVVEYHESYLKLHYLSKDKEENFPGNLHVWVEYKLTEENKLEIKFTAQSDQDTIINLTIHPYFNLSRHNQGDIAGHQLWIDADKFIPVTSEFIPIGGFCPVDNSPFDFRELKSLGDVIKVKHKQLIAVDGYDHSFVMNKPRSILKPSAIIFDPESGRLLEIYTTETALHFYTANSLNMKKEKGKGGTSDGRRSAFCVEPQHFPDSPNQKDFPSTKLLANELWESKSIFKFDVINN